MQEKKSYIQTDQVKGSIGKIKYRKYQVPSKFKGKFVPQTPSRQSIPTASPGTSSRSKLSGGKAVAPVNSQKAHLEYHKEKGNFDPSVHVQELESTGTQSKFSFLNIRKDTYGFAIKKFISCLMKNGNKYQAEKILLLSFFFIKRQFKPKLIKVFFLSAINNVKPLVELIARQSYKTRNAARGSKLKCVPISSRRAYKLAIQWLIQGAKQRPEKNMALALSRSLIDAYQKKGYAIKKRSQLHSVSKTNFFARKTKSSRSEG